MNYLFILITLLIADNSYSMINDKPHVLYNGKIFLYRTFAEINAIIQQKYAINPEKDVHNSKPVIEKPQTTLEHFVPSYLEHDFEMNICYALSSAQEDSGDDSEEQEFTNKKTVTTNKRKTPPNKIKTSHCKYAKADDHTPKNSVYTCKICQKEYSYNKSESFKEHIRRHRKHFICDKKNCGASFPTKNELSKHQKTPHDRNLPCEINDCIKIFSSNGGRIQHRRNDH